jgi:quercetin dioxygenase-like cupin family protein
MNFFQQKALCFPQFDGDFFSLFRIHLDEGSVPDCDSIHKHDFLELLYCRSNCGAVFQLNNRDYSLQRGDILLIPPDTPHGWLQRSNSMDHIWVTVFASTLPQRNCCFSFPHTQIFG